MYTKAGWKVFTKSRMISHRTLLESLFYSDYLFFDRECYI